jgi:hypothetical protein
MHLSDVAKRKTLEMKDVRLKNSWQIAMADNAA